MMVSLDKLFASRRVLLFDSDQARRNGRADQLRRRGVEVICAGDITEGRRMWLKDFFRLILVETQNSPDALDFSEEIRSANPKQRLAFFVGRPTYLSLTPSPPLIRTEQQMPSDFALRLKRACELLSHPNGLREAALRILAARYSMHHQRGPSAGKANGNT